jgi:VCBS repeat-containing protein
MRQVANVDNFGSISLDGRLPRAGLASTAIGIPTGCTGADTVHGTNPFAVETPVPDTHAETSSNDAVDHAKSVDAPSADQPSIGELSSGDATPGRGSDDTLFDTASSSIDPGGGDGWDHFLASDGSFWFDTVQNTANDPASIAGATNSDAADFALSPEAAADNSAALTAGDFAAASPGLFPSPFQDGAPNFLVIDRGAAHSSQADIIVAVDGTATKPSDINNVPVYNDPGLSGPPSSPPSNAPILAWIGDTGAGTSGGGGSSGGGATSHNTAGGSGLVIDVVYDSSVNSAPAGFTAAVAAVVSYYESVFTDPVTITIDVGYGEIDGQRLVSGALGESETYLTSVSYSQLQSALVRNANAIGDTAAATSLPATSPVSGQYWLSTAEAEALGISGASSSVNGYVGFSSANLFAYNDSNGVPANQYDFFGVVAHEFSEVMGRQMMDGENFYGGKSYEPLDLFHYSAPGVRDFSGTTAGYASADGGKTSLDAFNTNPGGDFGDWAASAGNNAFDAFSYPGVVNAVTASGLTLMNLLGWDPASTTTPPASTPVVTVHLTQDTGWSSSDNITSNDALTGTADTNAIVTLTSGTKTLGTATANASGVWSFTPTGLPNGQQTIIASEMNAAGKTGTASLTFTLDTSVPTVTSETVSGSGISGGAGTLTAGQMVILTLGMSAAVMVVGGVPTLTLNDGGTATYDAVHSTSTLLVFDYTVAAGQYANSLAVTGINLHGATVTEIAGNAANLAGADTTFSHLLVDATTPVATSDHAHDLLNGFVSVSSAQAATSGVLANDTDPDPSDILSVSAVNGSAGNVGHSVTGTYGALNLSSNGSYTYTNTSASAVTAAGGVVEDTFSYTVSNGHGGTASSTLSVLITSPGETYVSGTHGGTITGGNGSYVLDGSPGNMNVTAGNSGTQWLVGGPGNTLTGGNSADTFLFAPNFGKETINNFNTAQDVIDLPHSEFASFAAVQADMHASGANTVIALDPNDAITLSHIAVANLHAQNFHFV